MVYTFYCVLYAVFLLFSFHIGSIFSTNLLVKEEEEERKKKCTCYDDISRLCDKLLYKLFPYLNFESTAESEQND